jgi:hypothetical protein
MKPVGGKALTHFLVVSMKLDVVTRIAGDGLCFSGHVLKTDFCFFLEGWGTLDAIGVLERLQDIPLFFSNDFHLLAEIEEPGGGAKRYSNRNSLWTKEDKRSLLLFRPTESKTQTVSCENFVQDAVEMILKGVKCLTRGASRQRHGGCPSLSVAQ